MIQHNKYLLNLLEQNKHKQGGKKYIKISTKLLDILLEKKQETHLETQHTKEKMIFRKNILSMK